MKWNNDKIKYRLFFHSFRKFSSSYIFFQYISKSWFDSEARRERRDESTARSRYVYRVAGKLAICRVIVTWLGPFLAELQGQACCTYCTRTVSKEKYWWYCRCRVAKRAEAGIDACARVVSAWKDPTLCVHTCTAVQQTNEEERGGPYATTRGGKEIKRESRSKKKSVKEGERELRA